ncbi:TonB-dependent receptor [Flexithrix dorotheae]|uniref:TonB-dependent receptor n=1 Tax=Flexithrix dorotheae TaxID=70993 RepID=UPI00035E26D0|nr:TonB-dependent receptor [Flexithrix dorotheae]
MKTILTYSLLVLTLVFPTQGQNLLPYLQDTLKGITLHEIYIEEEVSSTQPLSFYKKDQFASVEDILERTSGVSLVRRGNYAMEPTFRGMSGGQVNVTIDGMRMFGACTDKMDPVTSYVEPNNLNSLSLDFPNLHGSSIGGNLNLKIKEPIFNADKSWSGMAGVGYHSVSNGMNSLLSLNHSKGKWAYRINSVYRNHGNFTADGGKKVAFSQYEKFNLSFSAKYKLATYALVKIDFLMDNAWNVGYPALPMDVGFAKARIFAVAHQKFFTNGWLDNMETKLYLNSIRHSMDDTQRPDVAMHMDMPGKSDTYGFYWNGQLKKIGKHQLSVKVDGYQNLSRAEMTMYAPGEDPMFMLTWPEVNRSVLGLFIAEVIALNKKLDLTINARIEGASSKIIDDFGKKQLEVFGYDTDKTFYELPKSLSSDLNWKIGENWNTGISLAYAERLPTVSEQFGFYLFNSQDGYDYIGNPELALEKAGKLEGSFTYTKGWGSVTGKAFFYQFEDYIMGIADETLSPMTIGANGVKIYQNIPFATLSGWEMQFQAKPVSWLNMNSSFAFTYGNDHNGNPLPLIPPLKNITALKIGNKKFKIQPETEWGLAQNRIDENFGEDKTPSYIVFHLRGTFQLKNQKSTTTINGGIENIFDRNYHQHLDWGNIPRPGRNIYLSLNYSF